ncbi:carbamoyl-phosphate synthase L chain [Alicycliphilus sp. B1]|nr:carbamoyl-phosphate synthase L chain [Alicycliphilus sp. B1]
MFSKVLIANRGEIACRIARTLRRMGVAVATVHSTADANALHVQEIGESVWIGDGPARQSYLDIDAVLKAAQAVGPMPFIRASASCRRTRCLRGVAPNSASPS